MGKLTDDQLRFIIDIEANGAQGQINTLSAEIGKLEKQNASLSASLSKVNNELEKQEKKLAKMEASGKQNTTAYKQLAQSIEANRQKQAQLSTQLKQTQNALDKDREKVAQFTSSLKLNQMTMQQLRDRAAQLRKQLDVTSKAASPETYRKLQKELAQTTDQMDKLSKKTTSVGNIIKGNLWTAGYMKAFQWLIRSITQGIQTITSFESANASLAAVMRTTQDGVQRLTADAKRLGEVTEYSSSQVTMMQTELAKLGFNEKEILDSTQYILQFATATGSEIPAAAQLAGAALRAFGGDTSETQRYVSAMAVATTKSALNFEYLQNSMSKIAPVANAFGFTIEDTTALLGTLANSGFDASSAATATRNILLNLADSSGKLAQALGKPITSLDELAPALQELQEKGVSLNEALELTDKRSVAAFETFLNGADAITTLRDSITGVGDDLAAMQQTKLDTVEGSIKLMQSAWEGLMLQFYNSKGTFKNIVDLTTKIIGGLRNAVKWVQDNAKAVKIITGVLATYLVTGKAITLWRKADMAAMIAEMTTKIANIGVTKLAEQANESLKRSLLTSPWGLIAIAITAVIAGLVLFIKHAMEASDAQSVLNETQERAQDLAKGQIADANAEKAALNSLVKSIIETNDNERLRADLINQLESQFPEFLAHLDKEKVTNEQLQAALLNANDAYEDRIRLLKAEALAEAYKESIVEMNKKLIEQEIALSNTDSERKQEKLRKEIAETQKVIDKLSSSYNDAMSSLETARVEEDMNNSLEGLKRNLARWEQMEQQFRARFTDGVSRTEEELAYYQGEITQCEQRSLICVSG
ncbi:MAG: phage tail tape measure protein [Paludibacteraceae bacterium]|nr:phage tail tape measure protein [Paludibacteraceae bacterium]